MAKKRKAPGSPTTTVTVRPTSPDDVTNPPRHRRLRAQRSGDSFALLDDALDLGLVSGDVISCASGADGRRYLSGLVRLREGTLSQVGIGGSLCRHHFAEFVDQATDDWHDDGAARVQERGGSLYAFWPIEIPVAEASLAVDLSASEYRLKHLIVPPELRQDLISHYVFFGPPATAHAA
ncbi:MAG: hypothetical protein Q4G50_00745 [Corynebacterium sp.]|uniref:hypothetical protein n=1 Tax=Corynebacterium sp. TaxID=1720 RepID=UPI0026E0986B|nr:hypothetical protein [Corynebacterium sp.]MDO5668510.1 hypothetical protein [Corynebacterium sp.]